MLSPWLGPTLTMGTKRKAISLCEENHKNFPQVRSHIHLGKCPCDGTWIQTPSCEQKQMHVELHTKRAYVHTGKCVPRTNRYTRAQAHTHRTTDVVTASRICTNTLQTYRIALSGPLHRCTAMHTLRGKPRLHQLRSSRAQCRDWKRRDIQQNFVTLY